MRYQQRIDKLSTRQKEINGLMIFREDIDHSTEDTRRFRCKADPERLYTEAEVSQYGQDHAVYIFKVIYDRSSEIQGDIEHR